MGCGSKSKNGIGQATILCRNLHWNVATKVGRSYYRLCVYFTNNLKKKWKCEVYGHLFKAHVKIDKFSCTAYFHLYSIRCRNVSLKRISFFFNIITISYNIQYIIIILKYIIKIFANNFIKIHENKYLYLQMQTNIYSINLHIKMCEQWEKGRKWWRIWKIEGSCMHFNSFTMIFFCRFVCIFLSIFWEQ